MNYRTMSHGFFVLLLFMGLTVSFVQAGQYNRLTSDMNATLEGIKTIYVRVAPIDADLAQQELSQAKILENTNRQVERSGIKLLSEAEYDRLRVVRNYPLGQLEVTVAFKRAGEVEAKIYSVHVRMRQAVFLSRKPVIKVFAPTWEESTIGYTRDWRVIQAGVEDAVGKFIDAYRSVNP